MPRAKPKRIRLSAKAIKTFFIIFTIPLMLTMLKKLKT